jgi:uncharacterized membrane protein YhhN
LDINPGENHWIFPSGEVKMSLFIVVLALLFAIVDWIAVVKSWRGLEYCAKPAVILTLLIWVGVLGGFQGPMLWFVLGLLFSLAGDVFLMLPNEQFIAGLVSFLVAHLCYMIGFSIDGLIVSLPILILALVVFFAALRIYRRISLSLRADEKSSLQIPILLYSVVISIMLLTALATFVRSEWRLSAAVVASGGALLFFVSDTLLAWNRFVTPLPKGRLFSMMAYHLGQIGIAIGATLRYLLN